MKKFFLLFVIVCSAVTVNAQIQFGVKAGGNFYTFGGDDAEGEGLNSKFGIHAGPLVNISVSEKFKIQPELLFSIQGSKQEIANSEINWNFNYLNLPVMAQFYVSKGFFLETGPQVGFNLKADIKPEGGSTVDFSDEVKGIEFAWGLGAGYKVSSNFGVGARYNLGLTSIGEDADSDLKNRGLQVGVFYLFGGKKAK